MTPLETTPKIIYGTAWKKTETAALVATAIRQGFRAVDTACQPKHYDEAGVGTGVAACLAQGIRRADLYLQTKFTPPSGHAPNAIPYDPKAPVAEQVAQSARASLRNLQTDYLDCLVLHSPLPGPKQTLEVWRAMESLVDEGRVRALGISNCYELGQLETLTGSARLRPGVVQNRFYAETAYDVEIRAFCRAQGMVYQSFWTLTANPHLLADAAITALAAKYERSAAQILFRYLTQQGVVPLTGTRSQTHMREDLAIFEFELGAHEIGTLDAIVERPYRG